jgi:hypothetical protein
MHKILSLFRNKNSANILNKTFIINMIVVMANT